MLLKITVSIFTKTLHKTRTDVSKEYVLSCQNAKPEIQRSTFNQLVNNLYVRSTATGLTVLGPFTIWHKHTRTGQQRIENLDYSREKLDPMLVANWRGTLHVYLQVLTLI